MESLIDIINALIEFSPQLLSSMVLLTIFIGIWLITHTVFKRFIRHLSGNKKLIGHFLRKVLVTLIWIVATISILGTWGIDMSALITGLGLTGFAVGFALKDVLSNAISGILIILYQPFKPKDHIKVMGIEGDIVSTDMRYTVLKDKAQKHLIPNSKLLSEKVTLTTKEKKPKKAK